MTSAVDRTCRWCWLVLTALLAGTWQLHRGASSVQWAEERRELVDRAIARHAGEVVALDRVQPRARTGDRRAGAGHDGPRRGVDCRRRQ